jgi:hypothetical protein
MTMGQIYQQYSTVRSETNVYSPWEAEQTTACVCSIGELASKLSTLHHVYKLSMQ